MLAGRRVLEIQERSQHALGDQILPITQPRLTPCGLKIRAPHQQHRDAPRRCVGSHAGPRRGCCGLETRAPGRRAFDRARMHPLVQTHEPREHVPDAPGHHAVARGDGLAANREIDKQMRWLGVLEDPERLRNAGSEGALEVMRRRLFSRLLWSSTVAVKSPLPSLSSPWCYPEDLGIFDKTLRQTRSGSSSATFRPCAAEAPTTLRSSAGRSGQGGIFAPPQQGGRCCRNAHSLTSLLRKARRLGLNLRTQSPFGCGSPAP